MTPPEPKPPAPNRKLFIATIAIGVFILAGLLLDVHLIGKEVGGTALWNSKEAYFFIYAEKRGYRIKWLAYPLILLAQQIGYFQPVSDIRGDLHVVRVAATGVETRIVNLPDRSPGSGPGKYTPIEGRIWAHYPAIGGLSWWSGDHFEPATQEERRRIDFFTDLKLNFTDRNGWSSRGIGGPMMRIKLEPNVELRIFAEMSPPMSPLSIQKSVSYQLPALIYSLERGGGMVSSSEYRRTFQNPAKQETR